MATKNYLKATRTYYHDHLTWCVQKAKPIPIWKSIFHLCRNMDVYLGVLILAVALLLVIYYLFQYERPVRTWNEGLLIIFKVAIGISPSFEPKSAPFRIFYASGLLGGTIFSIVVNAVLMRNITTPILHPQIETIDEITSGEFKLIGDRFTLTKLKLQTDVRYLQSCFFSSN